jgi:hypothetical protein
VFELVLLVASAAAAGIGYWQARLFTQNKLRYVDAVHRMSVPIMAGVGAALIAAPVVWVIPFIGGGTAILFGAGVGAGVAAGARDIRKRIGAG